MDNESNKGQIYQGFLDTFCIRIDQLPMSGNTDNWGAWDFYPTNILNQEKVFVTHEGYINFNVNGVTYLSRDCEDVRTYLESLGYKEIFGHCVLAAWYNVDKIGSMLDIDGNSFRLYFGLSLIDRFSPTFSEGKIGKNAMEIQQRIEEARREDPIFNDELWLKSSWRKYEQIQKDRLYFVYAREYLLKCIRELGYINVYIPEILENPEDIVKIINYFRMSRGQKPDYVLSEAYIESIPGSIREYEEKQKGILIKGNYKIIIDNDEYRGESRRLLLGPESICCSEEELWESLDKYLDKPPIK